MLASIAAEQRNEYGAVIKKRQPCQRGQQSSRSAKKLKVDAAGLDNASDPNDSDFMSDGSSTDSLEDGGTEVDEAHPSNAEVFHIRCVDALILTCLALYRLRISSLPKPFRQLDAGQESGRGVKLLLKTSTARKHDVQLQLRAQSLKMMIRTKSPRS
jgi:hypothetical protein